MAFSGTGAYTIPAAGTSASAGKTIKSADWNTIFTDLQTALNQLGKITFNATATVNFNSVADTAVTITLPTGFTNYVLEGIHISSASQTLTTATVGVFTAAGGAGTAIVTGGSAVTVSTAAANTLNNAQSLSINNQNTQAFNFGTLYFRITNPQGVAATATVTFRIIPLS